VPRPLPAGEFTTETPEIAAVSEVRWCGTWRAASASTIASTSAAASLPRRSRRLPGPRRQTPASTPFPPPRSSQPTWLTKRSPSSIETVLGWLALRLLDETERATTRRQRREESETTLFARALKNLGSTASHTSTLAAIDADAVRLACLAVWQAHGIQIDSRPHRASHRHAGRRQRCAPAPSTPKNWPAPPPFAPPRQAGRYLWTSDSGPMIAWQQDSPIALLPYKEAIWPTTRIPPIHPRQRPNRRRNTTRRPRLLPPSTDRAIGFKGLLHYALERRGAELWNCAWTGAAAGLLTLHPSRSASSSITSSPPGT